MKFARTLSALVLAFTLAISTSSASFAETPHSLQPSEADSAQTLVIGPWTDYRSDYKSIYTCNADQFRVRADNVAKVYGGMYTTRCTTRTIPSCPKSFKIFVMQAKYWRYKNGPLSVPAVTSTAEHSSGSLASSAAAC